VPNTQADDKALASDPQRIRIRVPEYYKDTDSTVWEELERYLFEGFLVSSAHILGHTYVFKTLNHIELRNMEFLKPMKSSPPQIRETFRAAFIAHSVFMIDGMNALYERPKHINRLIKVMSKVDAAIQEKIVKNLAAINERASRLYPLVEVYVHENRSRFKWLALQRVSVHSPMATGIPGTDEIGMNHCQQTWTALNRMIDRREEMEKDWTNAKFIGSCFAGKGVRQIDERDKARHETERTEREDLKIKVLYRYLNRNAGPEDEPEQTVNLPDGRQATVVKRFQAISAEELAVQLEAALAGEKDYHDLAVENKERQLRARARELEQYKHQLYSPPVIIPPGAQLTGGVSGGTRVLGSKAEADAYIARMEALKFENIQKTTQQMSLDLNQTSDRPQKVGPDK
jgi:hypothetical protein